MWSSCELSSSLIARESAECGAGGAASSPRASTGPRTPGGSPISLRDRPCTVLEGIGDGSRARVKGLCSERAGRWTLAE